MTADTQKPKSLFLRLDQSVVDEIDRQVEIMKQKFTGLPVSRSAMMRILIDKGLAQIKAEQDIQTA